MNSKSTIWLCLFLMGLVGCERVVEVPYPPYRRQAVLTGLVQPDSLLTIRLTYNRPATDTTAYPVIDNAVVTFYENDRPLGQATSLGQGYYRLSYQPKGGGTYRVTASIPDYGNLEAQDYLPPLTTATLTGSGSNVANPNRNPDFTLSWQPAERGAVYWLSAKVQQIFTRYGPGCPSNFSGPLPPGCTLVDQLTIRNGTPLSNSTYADRFNASYELEYGYVFSYLLRMDPTQLPAQLITFPFTVYNSVPRPERRKDGEGLIVDFMAVGPGYDQYLKTVVRAMQSQVNDAESALDNPFVESAPVSSNVKNGLGLFGAMQRQRIRY